MNAIHGIGYLLILAFAFLIGLVGTVAASEALRASRIRPPAATQPATNTKIKLPAPRLAAPAYPTTVEC